MQHSFFQKAMLTILAGLAAAGMLWFYRHVIGQALWENNQGWRDIFVTPRPKR